MARAEEVGRITVEAVDVGGRSWDPPPNLGLADCAEFDGEVRRFLRSVAP